MNVIELKKYLIKNVPNFENPIIVENGECYHYTPHWDKIKDFKFKGAVIDKNLDQTQRIAYMAEAKEDIGVVFAYENIEHTREEGAGLDIIKISYKNAIKALHAAEEEFQTFSRELALELGTEMGETITLETILILTTDIISFEYVEKAPD